MWSSAMAENGILKIGKVTDFQGHMIEHQVGAYTNCNHGQGLADFIKEIGLPTTFAEMNIVLDDETVKKIAGSTVLTARCCKRLTDRDIEQILIECK